MPVAHAIRFPIPLSPEDWTPVVVYLRCSSPQQELSVDDQWRKVLELCQARRYRIVRVYCDEGKSASKEQEKRTGFNKMLREAKKLRDARVVVCYDMARFTRQNNIEAEGIDGESPKRTLMEAGMILDTCKDGPIDWNKSGDRWHDMAVTEAATAHSKNLSEDTIRGRVNLLLLGYWPNGNVPYGYDKEYTDGTTRVSRKRHERFSKGRDWHLRLVVNQDEAKIVREIFDLFCRRRWSRLAIADHLTSRGLRPPLRPDGGSAGCWHLDSVKKILTEKAYLGIATLGTRRRPRAAHNRIDPTEKPGACPRIIEADQEHIWHEAQEVLKEREKKRPKDKVAGMLSGFLICGHCGYRLSKSCPTRNNPHKKVWYTCRSAAIRKHLGCPSYRVPEDTLFPRVRDWLIETVDTDLLAALQQAPAQDDEGRSADEALLGEQVAALERQVQNATVNILKAPPGLAVDPWAIVTQWQEELEQTKRQLALVRGLRSAPELAGFRDWWETAKADLTECKRLGELAREPATGEPVQVQDWTLSSEPCEQRLGEWQTADEQVDPEQTYRENVRALMGKLGVTVRIWLEKNENRQKQQDLGYLVKEVQITAAVDPASLFESDHNMTHGPEKVEVKRLFTCPAA